MKQLKPGCFFWKQRSGTSAKHYAPHLRQTYVIVALDGVDKSLIGHNLRFSTEEGLKAFFHRLQLLFADLRDTNMESTASG